MNFQHLDMKKYKQEDKGNLQALKIDKNVKIKINSLRKYGNKK